MSSSIPIGWVVRVTMSDGVMMLYKAGFPMPHAAEEAVESARATPNETYLAVDPIFAVTGLTVEAGEVCELSSSQTR